MYLERIILRIIFALSVYNILLFMKPFSDTGERNLRAMSIVSTYAKMYNDLNTNINTCNNRSSKVLTKLQDKITFNSTFVLIFF
jgi:hypothetical protein